MAYLETWNIQKLGGILISVRHIVVSLENKICWGGGAKNPFSAAQQYMIWDQKLCMKTWYNSKIVLNLLIFWT